MNIFKSIGFFVLIPFLLACNKNENNNYVIVNIDSTFAELGNYELITYDLLSFKPNYLLNDSLKNFLKLHVSKPQFYYFKTQGKIIPIYIEPGFQIKLIPDTERTIIFEGYGSEINNHLTSLQLIQQKYNAGIPFFRLETDDFLLRIDSLENDFNILKKDIQSPGNLEIVSKLFELNLIVQKLNYALVHYNLNAKDIQIPVEIRSAFIEALNYPDLIESGFLDYSAALQMYRDAVISPEVWQEEFSNNDSLKSLYPLLVNDHLKKLEIDPIIKEFLIAKNIYFELLSKGLTENVTILIQQFQSKYSNSKYIASIQLLENDLKALNGEVAPEIACLDLKNKEVTLSDFRGKVVYLDIWATWCAPCIAQFPASKSLYQKYSKDEIVFVYLSVDKDRNKWKDFLSKNKDIKGIHLVEKENSSIFKAFHLSEIPSYMLLDQEGRIVNAHAPRPSSDKIEEMIDQLISS